MLHKSYSLLQPYSLGFIEYALFMVVVVAAREMPGLVEIPSRDSMASCHRRWEEQQPTSDSAGFILYLGLRLPRENSLRFGFR